MGVESLPSFIVSDDLSPPWTTPDSTETGNVHLSRPAACPSELGQLRMNTAYDDFHDLINHGGISASRPTFDQKVAAASWIPFGDGP